MKIEVEAPALPLEWEYTGELRLPKKGEYYLSSLTHVHEIREARFDHTDTPLLILRKRTPKMYWVNIYPNNKMACHPTKEEADTLAITTRIRCIRVMEVAEA